MKRDEALLYWRFLADVRANGVATLRFAYLSERRGRTPDAREDGYYVVLFGGESNGELTRHAVGAVVPEDIPGPTEVSGAVPFHPETRLIVLMRDRVRVLEVSVPERPPHVRLRREAIGARGQQRLEWEGGADQAERLSYSVFVQIDDGRRYPLVNHTRDTALDIDVDGLPGCRAGRLVVRASDYVFTAEAETKPFALPMKAPLVRITHPRDHARVPTDQPLQLQGQGWDVQRQRPIPSEALEWLLDGEFLGRGRLLVLHRLHPGPHTIMVRAKDDGGRVSYAQVPFVAAPTPTPKATG